MKAALVLIPEKINGLLNDYVNDLEEAWSHLGESEFLNINLSAKIGFDKHSKPACEVTIAFIKEKIKGSVTFNWDDRQDNLFKTIKGIDDRLNKEGNSMTITGNSGKSVTLGKRD